MVRMQRRFSEFLISAGALVALIVVLAAFDGRVREQIELRLAAGSASEQVADAGGVVRDLAAVIFDAVRDQSIQHAPLVIFVLAATTLLEFMLRT